MAQRKTVEVLHVLKKVNTILARDLPTNSKHIGDPKSFKLGLCSVLDDVLNNSGNYVGFSFLGDATTEPEKRVYLYSDAMRAELQKEGKPATTEKPEIKAEQTLDALLTDQTVPQ